MRIICKHDTDGCSICDHELEEAQIEIAQLKEELKMAAILNHEDSMNLSLYPRTLHKNLFKNCPADICTRRQAAITSKEKREGEKNENTTS